jgi:hypothetical protein
MWVFFKVSWVFAGFGEILVISVVWLVLVIVLLCSFGRTGLGFAGGIVLTNYA